MNIDEMTIGEFKQLSSIFGGNCEKNHPLVGQKVVAILPHGFIYFGLLSIEAGNFKLTEASNLRYWKQRTGGLPEFAKTGPVTDDKIDKISGCVCFDVHIAIVPCGLWDE